MKTFDVCVVGAGPAGCTAAALLARAGLDVALIDRKNFPREKPCGDCLSAAASSVLQRIGVLASVHEQQPAALHGWRIVAPDGGALVCRFADCGPVDHALAISRDRLDSILYDHALATGAHALHFTAQSFEREGSLVCIRDNRGSERLRARLLVGADGLRSRVASAFGLVRRAARVRKVSVTMHVHRVKHETSFGEMHVRDGVCIGIAPVSAGPDIAWNVTTVFDSDRFGRDVAGDPERAVRRAVESVSSLAGFGEMQRLPGTRVLGSGPFDRPMRRATLPGLALIGDAAGYFDPFTGQGIFQALRSGEIVAEEIAAAFENGRETSELLGYARRQRELVNGNRLLQKLIDTVLARPATANLFIRRLAAATLAGRQVIAVTGDLEPARSLLSPRMLVSFLTENRAEVNV